MNTPNPEPRENPYAPPRVPTVRDPDEFDDDDPGVDESARAELAQQPVELAVEPSLRDWFDLTAIRNRKARLPDVPAMHYAFTWRYPWPTTIVFTFVIMAISATSILTDPKLDESTKEWAVGITVPCICIMLCGLGAVSFIWMANLRRQSRKRIGFFQPYRFRFDGDGITFANDHGTERLSWYEIVPFYFAKHGIAFQRADGVTWIFLPRRSFTADRDWKVVCQLGDLDL